MEIAQPLEPIGLSLLESTQPTTKADLESSSSRSSQDYVETSKGFQERHCPPSLLSTAASEAGCPQSACNSNLEVGNILMQGPDGSGRSSLAMDFALEIASKTPCLCQDNVNCECSPVVFLRANNKEDSFPLCCQQWRNQDAEAFRTHRKSDDSTWSFRALRRIQVHHFANFRDCLSYLLSVTGKPADKQPRGAIVIDDVESLVTISEGQEDRIFRVMQLLAILLDTVNFVAGNPRVVVTMNSNLNFPSDSLIASLFNTKIYLHEKPQNSGDWNNGKQSEETNTEVIVSTWSAKAKSTRTSSSGFVSKVIDYVIIRNRDEDYRIIWKANAS